MKKLRELFSTILWLGGLALFFYFGVADPHALHMPPWICPRWTP